MPFQKSVGSYKIRGTNGGYLEPTCEEFSDQSLISKPVSNKTDISFIVLASTFHQTHVRTFLAVKVSHEYHLTRLIKATVATITLFNTWTFIVVA